MTPDAEDFLIVFGSKNYKTHLCKFRSREDEVSSKSRCQRVANNEFPACVTGHGQLRVRTMTKQTNFVLGSKTLYYYHFVGHCGTSYGLKWRIWRAICILAR